jgi:hypothetical protein
MPLDLTDDEKVALISLLAAIIEKDAFPLRRVFGGCAASWRSSGTTRRPRHRSGIAGGLSMLELARPPYPRPGRWLRSGGDSLGRGAGDHAHEPQNGYRWRVFNRLPQAELAKALGIAAMIRQARFTIEMGAGRLPGMGRPSTRLPSIRRRPPREAGHPRSAQREVQRLLFVEL